MADGGAWQSGVFDTTGRHDKQGYNPQRQGPGSEHVALGVPPPVYNQPPRSLESSAKASTIISITLRVATIVFTMIAFAIIASNKGENYWVKWIIIKNSAAAFLLAANVIVCFYSLVQLVVALVRGCIGARMLSGPTTPDSTITFVFDTALTYLMMAACGAGTCHAVYNSRYELCDGFRVFCDKQISSVVISFLAFVCMALSVALHNVRWYKMATKLA